MKMEARIALGAGVAFVLLMGGTCASSISWHNGAVKLENTTKAQWTDNQNTYDSFWKKVSEVAQVPSQYKDDFKDLLATANTAKYGKDGSQAQMQWFKDRQINLDAGMYRQLMQVIEAGRDDFKRAQTMLSDKQRRYRDKLEMWPGSTWASWHEFPRVVKGDAAPPKDSDGDGVLTVLDYPIVTSAKTKQAFATGEDEALDVFGKGKK